MPVDLDSFVAVPLPLQLVTALLKKSPHGVSTLIEEVMTDFLERVSEDAPVSEQMGGVYWEALFLPNGTKVQTKYFGQLKVAAIENGAIVWEGEVYPSMAQLSNTMRGGKQTNAWRELQLMRPQDHGWVSAQALRK